MTTKEKTTQLSDSEVLETIKRVRKAFCKQFSGKIEIKNRITGEVLATIEGANIEYKRGS